MALERDLVRCAAEPIILHLVSERPMYGYQIIKVVNERSNGAFEWKEGTLYPCLHRLEGAGLIKSEWQTAETGRRRKYYGITRKGSAVLAEKTEQWSRFSVAVSSILCAPASA